MNKLAILGSGELAQQIAHLAEQTKKFDIVGFIDRDLNAKETSYPIIGTDNDVLRLYEAGQIDCISIGVGYVQFALREKLYNTFVGKIPLATIIHPSSYVDEKAIIGEGCVIYPSCSIGMYSQLEDNVILNTSVVVCHDDVIKKHSYISPACNIAGKVQIGSRCMIGIGTTVIDHITIGDDVITGGGSVVVSDIFLSGTYVGVPVKKIK